LNHSFHQTGEEETVMKRSPDKNSLCGAQPTKKVRLGEPNEDEVTFVGITSTSESEDKESTTLTHLPNELLECILLKLNYNNISKFRLVCRKFREVGDDILNRQFRRLKNYVKSELDALVLEESLLRWNLTQNESGSTGRAEYNSADPKIPSSTYQLILIRCRGLLSSICNQIRLLRALSYRLFFLSDVPPNISYSSAFFAGKIIDEVHRILRIVKTRRIDREPVDEDKFLLLVNKWIFFFLKRIDLPLIQQVYILNHSTYPDLLGSKVIDLLECFFNCKKDTSVNID
jgi:hypothetical protein